jgi:hypothetical protein
MLKHDGHTTIQRLDEKENPKQRWVAEVAESAKYLLNDSQRECNKILLSLLNCN